VSTRVRKIARLTNKQYRDAFVGSQISIGLPFQIRALREQRGWKQSRLASEAGMLQPRISAMENPGGAKFNLETLRRLASAFDVALVVRFVPFGELVDWSERFNPDTFSIPNFEDDPALKEQALQEPGEVAAAEATQAVALKLPATAKVGDLSRLGISQEAANKVIASYAKQWRTDYLEPLKDLGLKQLMQVRQTAAGSGAVTGPLSSPLVQAGELSKKGIHLVNSKESVGAPTFIGAQPVTHIIGLPRAG
jgi:transcriptional regulator with XRE-family HTH domain